MQIVPGSPIVVGGGTSKSKWQKAKTALTSKRACMVYGGIVGLLGIGLLAVVYANHLNNMEEADHLYQLRLENYETINRFYFRDRYINYARNENGYAHSFSWPLSDNYNQPELKNLYNDIVAYNKYAPKGMITFKPYLSAKGKIYKLCFTLPGFQ